MLLLELLLQLSFLFPSPASVLRQKGNFPIQELGNLHDRSNTCLLQKVWKINEIILKIYNFTSQRKPLSSVQSLSHVRLFAPPWTAACQASLSITNSWSLLKLMSIELVMSISSSVVPLSSHLQSFPASGSFQMSQLFPSGGQSIRVSTSTSVLPMNIQY